MRIESLLPKTLPRLAVIDANAAVRNAAFSLSTRGFGLVIVVDGDGKAIGALSKSDLVRYLTNPEAVEPPVTALMSCPVISCTADDDVHAVWQIMVAQEIQNLPVLNRQSQPIGILDIRDITKALIEEEELQEHMLIDYIAGVGYR